MAFVPSFLKYLERRVSSIDDDPRIENDTKPMIPYMKELLCRGIVSHNGQGGGAFPPDAPNNIIPVWAVQRTFIDLILPYPMKWDNDDAKYKWNVQQIDGFIADLVEVGYIVHPDGRGFLVPGNDTSLVVKKVTGNEVTMTVPLTMENPSIFPEYPPNMNYSTQDDQTAVSAKYLSHSFDFDQEMNLNLNVFKVGDTRLMRQFTEVCIIDPVWARPSDQLMRDVTNAAIKWYPILDSMARYSRFKSHSRRRRQSRTVKIKMYSNR